MKPIGVGSLRGDDLLPAWGALTAAILAGSQATEQGTGTHERMVASVERFPIGELDSLTPLQCAEMCADNVAEALNLLAKAVGVDLSVNGEPISGLALLALAPVRRDEDPGSVSN